MRFVTSPIAIKDRESVASSQRDHRKVEIQDLPCPSRVNRLVAEHETLLVVRPGDRARISNARFERLFDRSARRVR
jgi:hypothetical protein